MLVSVSSSFLSSELSSTFVRYGKKNLQRLQSRFVPPNIAFITEEDEDDDGGDISCPAVKLYERTFAHSEILDF